MTMSRIEREQKVHYSDIYNLQDLRDILEENVKYIDDQLIRLAMSDKPEDNVRRSRLLGQRDFAISLRVRIKDESPVN